MHCGRVTPRARSFMDLGGHGFICRQCQGRAEIGQGDQRVQAAFEEARKEQSLRLLLRVGLIVFVLIAGAIAAAAR